MNLKKLQEKNQNFKEKYQSFLYSEEECLVFGGVSINSSMDFSICTDNVLFLYHTIVHTLFLMNKLSRDKVNLVHAKLLFEFQKRGLIHKSFDELDKL